jgi:AcrR family transcriptional regulator
MKDIAAEAGVSVESVYARGSKASLLLACSTRRSPATTPTCR